MLLGVQAQLRDDTQAQYLDDTQAFLSTAHDSTYGARNRECASSHLCRTRGIAERACKLESEGLCASQGIELKAAALRCQVLMQDAVVARQYINDNGSFQRQARLWTGQWLRRMLRLTAMHASQLELAIQRLLCASVCLCAGLASDISLRMLKLLRPA